MFMESTKEWYDILKYNEDLLILNTESDDPFYLIKQIKSPGNLEKRLVTKNIKNQGTIIGFQKFSQFDVLTIEKNKIATEFSSYAEVFLKYDELRQVVNDGIWQERLSRFGGVYLIHDIYTGKNYVGVAYNEDGGFLGRWRTYANNPTGGNKEKGKRPTLHMCFTGNSGTGKTSVARIIGKMFE